MPDNTPNPAESQAPHEEKMLVKFLQELDSKIEEVDGKVEDLSQQIEIINAKLGINVAPNPQQENMQQNYGGGQ